MKKTEKPFFVENLTGQLKSATCLVLVDYKGLTVKGQQELKNRLKESGARMEVIKNTLLKRAGIDAKVDEGVLSDTVLAGPTAMIVTEGDPIAPIQVLGKFAKESGIPQFKVGIVENIFQDKDGLTKISALPSKEILYAQTVGAISAPLYGIVGVLKGNLQKLVYVLSEASKK